MSSIGTPQRLSGNVAESLDSDIACMACAYPLRGLDRRGVCPECGMAVAASIEAAGGLTKHELASLCSRMLGLWFLARGVLNIPAIGWSLVALLIRPVQSQAVIGDWPNFAFIGLYTVLSFAMGLILWLCAPWIGRMMLPINGRVFFRSRLRLWQLHRIAVGTLGLYFVTTGIIGVVISVFHTGLSWVDFLSGGPDYPHGWVASLAHLLVGLALVLGRKRLVELFRRIQRPGLSAEATN